ncbi:MAG: hypothetical protein COA79_01450 [Planctomycetota bacterium]|nr:MAG: hypothetical protein COA79_01450 [Planctomycetota bacterium]
MHPLVDCLVNRNQTIDVLMQAPHCPTDEISKLILEIQKLHEALSKLDSDLMKRKLSSLILRSNALNLKESPSIDLTIIFLMNLSDLYSLQVDGENVFKILNNALSFITDKVHPSVRAQLIFTIEFYRIQYRDGFESSKNELCKLQKKIKFKTALDKAIYIGIFKLLASEAYLREDGVHSLFIKLSKAIKNKNSLLKIKFFDCVARGDLDLSQKLLDQIPASDIDLPVQEHKVFLNFQKNNWNSSSWGIGFQTGRKPWLQHFVLLHEGKPTQALKIIKSLVGGKIVSYSEIQKNLLFAELANGHIESSLFLLKKYLIFNAGHYFNAFYQMYFELINNNYSMARRYYEDVSKACVKYKSEGKLDFYLNLAPNISPSDIRKMQRTPYITNLKSNKNIFETSNNTEESKDVIIGSSEATKTIGEEIKKYADINVPILILGETGVGKDIVARNLHNLSKRSKEKFLAINCGAINDSLLQSELFGHVSGAFTGAEKDRVGVFEAAGKGTVFLDEFGEITPQLQIALLRTLENREVRPVGATETRSINCHILLATNANLQEMVDQKKFRKDLLFRINKLIIQISPLRDRTKDILDLVKHYFAIEREDQKSPRLSQKLEEAFINYPWPGNIRELKNEIEIARVLNSEKSKYDVDDFKKLFKIKKETVVESDQSLEGTEVPVLNQAEADLKRALELRKSRSKGEQRIARIKSLLDSLGKVYRVDLVDILQVTPKTVTSDLKKLIQEGYISRIEPTSAPCTHYFVINKIKE